MLRTKTAFWRGVGLFAGTTALLAASTTGAFSAPGGIRGPGGGEEEEEGFKNLSVPAVYVGSVGVGTPTCTPDNDTVLPLPADIGTVDPVTSELLFPTYWIQGEDTWQADCMVATDSPLTTAAWGDNLGGAPLKIRTPIRVEVGLLANASLYPMTGFGVDKLTDELDRYATYGTDDGAGIPNYPEVRVWGAGSTYSIQNLDTLTYPVPAGTPMSAEINSTGRIVFGAQFTTQTSGDYRITFTSPNVDITTVGNHSASIDIKVGTAAGGGGKGGGGGGKPDNTPGTGDGGGGGNGPGGPGR